MKTNLFCTIATFFIVVALLTGTISADASEITFVTHSVFRPLIEGDLLDQFQKDTGITVNLVTLGHKELVDKVTLEWLAETGAYDVIGWSGTNFSRDYIQFMSPLNELIDGADPDWDFDDITRSIIDEFYTFDDYIYALPIRPNTQLLYYRKDLFEQHGLSVPETWDDFLRIAHQLTLDRNGDGQTDLYGVALFGDAVYSRETASIFVHSFGGKFVEQDPSGNWKAVIDSEEALAALNFLHDLYAVHKVTPPGMPTYNNEDVLTAMQQDLAAMAIMTGGYYANIENPTQSKVAGKVGYAPIPTIEGRSYPGTGFGTAWGVAIDRNSKNKGAAWQFVQFLTSKKMDIDMAIKGNTPFRQSTYRNEIYQQELPLGLAEALGLQMASNVGIYTISSAPADWHEWSGAIFNAVIAGIMKPEQALIELERNIENSLETFEP